MDPGKKTKNEGDEVLECVLEETGKNIILLLIFFLFFFKLYFILFSFHIQNKTRVLTMKKKGN